jgi:hypothetical protein
MGVNDYEQSVIDRSKDVFSGLTDQWKGTQGIRNDIDRTMLEKVDPYFQNLKDFGVTAKNQGDDLAVGWGRSSQTGQEDMAAMFDQLRGYSNQQGERWGQNKTAIDTAAGKQSGAWDQNQQNIAGANVQQKQTWSDFLGGVNKAGAEQQTGWQKNLDAVGQAGKDVGGLYAKPRSTWEGQVDDPNKRGFDPATLQAMYSQGAEQAQAGQSNSARQIAKLNASEGGSAGGAMRNMQQAQEAATQAQMKNAQGIGIAQGTAQREDLASALQGLTQIGSLTDTGQSRYADMGLSGRSAMNANQSQMLGLGLQGTESMNAGERSMIGLDQNAIATGNRDQQNLLSLGTDSEKARAADLTNVQGMQKDALAQKADVAFKGLAGQGSAYELGNNAQLGAFSQQGDALKTINDYMNTNLNSRQLDTTNASMMLQALDRQLQADALWRGDPGFFASMKKSAGTDLGKLPGDLARIYASGGQQGGTP